MLRAIYYSLLLLLTVIGAVAALRAVEVLLAGSLSLTGAGRVWVSGLFALLCSWGAWKVFSRLRFLRAQGELQAPKSQGDSSA